MDLPLLRPQLSDEVAQALAVGAPIVALESTVISSGLPFPENLETARACEAVIRSEDAVPCTVAVIAGLPSLGLSVGDLERLAYGFDPGGRRVEKVSLNNLAHVMTNRLWGGTTVAASIRLTVLGGLQVFATGGIGGVHRGASESFDVSADLTALASHRVVCVCSGAKAILDLPATFERLETLGVPVIGYGADEIPSFYSRESGLPVDSTASAPEQVAEIVRNHWSSGARGAVLVCVPVPEAHEIPRGEIDKAVEESLRDAESRGVKGKALTPLLLSRLSELTGGKTLAANRALLENNSRVAARIAVFLKLESEATGILT